MRLPRRPFSSLWIVFPLMVLAVIFWFNARRVERVDALSRIGVVDGLPLDTASVSGYSAGTRPIVLPERDARTYQWIVQTQQLRAEGAWRLRRVDYDNAPVGRAVSDASPYRWWLWLVAAVDSAFSNAPTAVAIERTARWSDPLLHGLFVLSASLLAAWRFGALAGALVAVGAGLFFPFSGWYSAGLLEDRGLALGLGLLAVLCLFGATNSPARGGAGALAPRSSVGLPLAAGVLGALSLWIDPAGHWPLVAGLLLGGAVSLAVSRKARVVPVLTSGQWRIWGLTGAIAVGVAYLLEFAPDHLGVLRLDAVHPLYGVAWMSAAEGLARWTDRGGERRLGVKDVLFGLLALAGVAALPIAALATESEALWGNPVAGGTLARFAAGMSAPNLGVWLSREGLTLATGATLAPGLILLLGAWLCFSKNTPALERGRLLLAAGPVVVALGIGLTQLRWWAGFDLAMIVLAAAVVVAVDIQSTRRWPEILLVASVVLAAGLGVIQLKPEKRKAEADLAQAEVEALLERDVAYWLANRVGSPSTVVLAPPALSMSLVYHGGLRALGTPDPANQDGFAAAVRIASASSPDEARALMERRGVTHVILPSWDSFLDEYARLGPVSPENSLIGLLHRWLPPRWLRPIAYPLPKVAGFEGQRVTVFEVVELQDNLTALARLAEYFSEMGRLDEASAAGQALMKMFPDETDALLGRAQVALACGERADLLDAVKQLEAQIAEGAEQLLPWDRRLTLAVVLAEAKRFEAAREQFRRCLQEIDEPKIRGLSSVALFRLHALCRGFREPIPDAKLAELARKLLPPEMRAR